MPLPADYIATDKPVGKQFTEQVVKEVSRYSGPGRRKMMTKVSEPKLRQLDPSEVTESVRKMAMDRSLKLTEMAQRVLDMADLLT